MTGTAVGFWDFVGYALFSAFLGSFSLWLVGFFVWEVIKYAVRGPSEQLKSVGTSILDEPPLAPVIPLPGATREPVPPTTHVPPKAA